MSTGLITALVCAALSAAFLIYLIAGAPFPVNPDLRKYIIATSAVHLSGTVLVAILFFAISDLPMIFAVMYVSMKLFIFLMSMVTIIFLGKKMKEISNEYSKADQKRDKESV